MVARILEDSLMATQYPYTFLHYFFTCRFSMVKVLVLDLELEHQL